MGIWPLCHKVAYKPQTVVEERIFCRTLMTVDYTTCTVNAKSNLGRYMVFQGDSATSENCSMYCL